MPRTQSLQCQECIPPRNDFDEAKMTGDDVQYHTHHNLNSIHARGSENLLG